MTHPSQTASKCVCSILGATPVCNNYTPFSTKHEIKFCSNGDCNHREACHATSEPMVSPTLAWISVEDRMPEPGTDCLVVLCWDDQQPYIGIDTWDEQHEAPLSFSSATICTGLAWNEHDFDEISHWIPLSALPAIPAIAASPSTGEA
jgi:hypothetical protein